jgi:AGCS family alanine or glycine:cation symporter
MTFLSAINDVLWHDSVLYVLLGVGALFTLWTRLGQFRALTHGVQVIRGRYDRREDPGAISHFQALSAALSATVGLGNIAGVAIAVSLGGPGAVFWMWVTGFIGMALKMTEVTQAMLYRNLEERENPHGGAMWVVSKGLARFRPALRPLGAALGGVFCVTLLVSTITGGNMFQAWNVCDISREYFGAPPLATGLLQLLLVGAVIIGGIRRIGTVAARLVPFMCVTYLVAGVGVLVARADRIPEVLRLIFVHAFTPHEAQGAFLGGAFAWAFLFGMRRALFSNEAGQGSAPIAHAAARTDEPVREGVVAGLEPFVDTLVVCTVTAGVILLSGVWNRPPDAPLDAASLPAVVEARDASGQPAPGLWTLQDTELALRSEDPWRSGQDVFAVVAAEWDGSRRSDRHRLPGRIREEGGRVFVRWETHASVERPALAVPGIYRDYKGATLTAKAFDSVLPGLGFLLVPAAAWLFAISTMISWSYYGEQGSIFLFGRRSVMSYRVLYCVAILVASTPFIRTETELDVVSSLGTGVMLFANIPIMLVFGREAMRAYHRYIARLDGGEFRRNW